MNTHELWFKQFCRLANKSNQGFTLIELLVTVMIIGILAAVALPVLLGQVQKSRESEAKLNLGSINRAQQSERFEKGSFALLGDLSIAINASYYSYADVGIPDSFQAIYTATPITTFENDMHDYSAAVGQILGGGSTLVICGQDVVDGATPPIPPTVTSGISSCTAGTSPVY